MWGLYQCIAKRLTWTDEVLRVPGDDEGGGGARTAITGDCDDDRNPSTRNDDPNATDPSKEEEDWIVIPARR